MKQADKKNNFNVIGALLIALIILTVHHHHYLPSSVLASIPSSQLDKLYPSNIYKVAEHVHSVDEASVSNHYYTEFLKGYDALFFAYQSDRLQGSDIDDSDFESYIPLSSWTIEKSGTFSDGYPIIETSDKYQADGKHSLHLKSSSSSFSSSLSSSESSNDYTYAGVSQTATHPTPLSANLKISYKIYPVSFANESKDSNSQIQVRFTLLHWDSKSIAPQVVFVHRQDSPKIPNNFRNDTNTVYLLRETTFNTWNTITENVSDIVNSYWGLDFMRDQALKTIQLRVYTQGAGIGEVYFDSLKRNTTFSNSDVYALQNRQLNFWSTPHFMLLPGVEQLGDSNFFSLNVPAQKFIESGNGSIGPWIDINNLHNSGLYVGLAHPFQNDSQSQLAMSSNYEVDMIDIYGNRGCEYVTDTGVWDNYLNKGIFAMATATPNAHGPSAIDRMNTEAFANYVFSSSSDADDLTENIAMGRSFIESVSVAAGSSSGLPMLLYFSAQEDEVPMGRYPIIVDNNTSTANLHIMVTNIPSTYSNLNLIIKKDGTAIGEPISILGGTAKFDKTFSFSLSDEDHDVGGGDDDDDYNKDENNSSYFRYEIQDPKTGKPIAFSQPLIFVKNSYKIFPSFWTALVPENTAALDLIPSSVSFENNILSEKIKARIPQTHALNATVKIYVPNGMFGNDNLTVYTDPSNKMAGNNNDNDYVFNSTSRILTVNTIIEGLEPVTINVASAAAADTVDRQPKEKVLSPDLLQPDNITGSTNQTTEPRIMPPVFPRLLSPGNVNYHNTNAELLEMAEAGASGENTARPIAAIRNMLEIEKSPQWLSDIFAHRSVYYEQAKNYVIDGGTGDINDSSKINNSKMVNDYKPTTSNILDISLSNNRNANPNNTPALPYHYEPYLLLNGSKFNFKDLIDSGSLHLTKFSIAAWFNTVMDVPFGCNAFIINKGGIGSDIVGQNLNYGMWMTHTNRIQAGFETSQGGTQYYAISPSKYDDGKWHYGVVTYDGSEIKLYIDGIQVAKRVTGGDAIPDNFGTQPVRIGANSLSPDGYFIGLIDEVRMWNRAITDQEITNAYGNGIFNRTGEIVHLPFG